MSSIEHHAAGLRRGLSALLVAWLASACSGTAVVDGDGQGAGKPIDDSTCAERIVPVACRADPPDCPSGQFPAAEPDGSCWTGTCVDCVDGCQRDDECIVVRACGCSYHEGCSWAETTFRAARLPDCVAAGSETCGATCPSEQCSQFECPWCDADGAECTAGRCEAVVTHMCY